MNRNNRNLSDRVLSDRVLSDRVLSDKILSDKILSDKILNDTWIIYDHEKSNNDDYDKSTRIIGQFNTVIDFWTYYNQLLPPSKLFYQKDIGKPYYEIIEASITHTASDFH